MLSVGTLVKRGVVEHTVEPSTPDVVGPTEEGFKDIFRDTKDSVFNLYKQTGFVRCWCVLHSTETVHHAEFFL